MQDHTKATWLTSTDAAGMLLHAAACGVDDTTYETTLEALDRVLAACAPLVFPSATLIDEYVDIARWRTEAEAQRWGRIPWRFTFAIGESIRGELVRWAADVVRARIPWASLVAARARRT